MQIFYFLAKFIIVFFSLEDLKVLKSCEQIKGAKKPVRKTSARIFWALGMKSNKELVERFLNKICKKYKVPHNKLAIEQIKPYLKCPTKILLCILILPNQAPHITKPGIWVKWLYRVKESKIRPKNKPKISPLIDPLIIDQGNNQNNGQYGWTPKNPIQLGCHKKNKWYKNKANYRQFFCKKFIHLIFTFKIWTQSITWGLAKSDIFAVFFVLNDSSIDWTKPIGIFGGNKVLAGEDETKSPTFISASFE